MKYRFQGDSIPQNQRQALNEKVIYLIDSGTAEAEGISKEDVFNAYTGDGGLHGLKQQDFDNYHEYSEAKKECENGQFFTPADLCQFITSCLRLSADDVVADLTCGMGNFFNFVPTESNVYGCELDIKAFKVAHYLYPSANLENKDIRVYDPPIRFDYVVGNPPFNLRWWIKDKTEILSQLYYCLKAGEVLKPLGILALVVPASFLADHFTDGGMIRELETHFSFLGQVRLPDTAFTSMGVGQFPTKVQFWQKRSDAKDWEAAPYRCKIDFELPQGFSVEKAAEQVFEQCLKAASASLQQNKSHILLELSQHRSQTVGFEYQVKKMLYQIKAHPLLKPRYTKCCEYLHRFYTQRQPEGMKYQEWCRVRITEAKVLSYLRQTLQKQHIKPQRDVIALVKQDYQFIYKGYSQKARRQMTNEMKIPVPVYEAVLQNDPERFPGYQKLLRKKRREYETQSEKFAQMQDDPNIARWLEDFWLWDEENEEEIRLNELQRHDINQVIQKRYSLLQWEQGSGKTLAGIAVGLYRMLYQKLYCTWVVSSAISIRNNWDIVLPNYNLPYVAIERLADLERIRPGDFVLITLNKLGQYRKQIKRWLRIHGQKVQLVFDESDEITNPSSVRTKAALDCFRRCRAKLLDTGTTTRNNISEFAPQLELLYNNSINMISWCQELYSYDKGSRRVDDEDCLKAESNPYYGQPIPAYKPGYSLFSDSHLPEKITVFGVGQRTQDIFNADELNDLLDKTVITRTLKEVTGKEIRRIHQVLTHFSPAEKAVYQQAIDEFHRMRDNYFSSTGNSRKDSMMRLIQQITLLLRISAAPNTLKEYAGDTPMKIRQVVEMAKGWGDEVVAIGVRHKVVLSAYEQAIREAMPGRPLFVVTGTTTTLAKRRALRKTLKESKNGILLCTQQSLPSSVNFEFVNKIVIPELHYNNARMSQFYMRFVRYTSKEWKDIYFVTYAGSIESNQLQMVMAKEKINLFMKGRDTDLDEIYERFGVDYDLLSLLMYREVDDKGHFKIRWGEQKVS